MFSTKFLIVMQLLAAAVPAFADDAKTILEGLSKLSSINGILDNDAEYCSATAQPADGKPSCYSLARDYCRDQWSKENEGNTKLYDGQFNAGYSKKSYYSKRFLMDVNALVDSKDRLPADLKKNAEPALAEIKDLLAKEESGDEWKRKLQAARIKYDHAVEDTLKERRKNRYPGIWSKEYDDRTPEENTKLEQMANELNDEILVAKYEKHDNWNRVENLFPKVKEHVLAEIDAMKVSAEKKAALRKQVADAQLTLPFSHPNKLSAGTDCQTTQVNAFYLENYNKLTVCAGYFNAYASEAALYWVLAHELGHSIDPTRQANCDHRQHGVVKKLLAKLEGSQGKAFACGDWEKAVAAMQQVKPDFSANSKPELSATFHCVTPDKDLKPLNAQSAESAVKRKAEADMALYADQDLFKKISNPEWTKAGVTRKNQMYLRPDVYVQFFDRKPKDAYYVKQNSFAELFSQSLACQSVKRADGTAVSITDPITDDERARLVKQGIEQTKTVHQAALLENMSYCRENCDYLKYEQMGSDADENFADLVAAKAMSRYMEHDVKPENRRDALKSYASSLPCAEPNAYRMESTKLDQVEKEVGVEPHAADFTRLNSWFTPKNAGLLGCTVLPSEEGYSKCDY